jgi:GntR family transcriptional regulator
MPLPVQVNKHNGIPLYIQLEEQIRLLMHRGKLKPGDLMPTVRALAVELEVNSNTVSRVYRDLQNEGLLTLRRGVGTSVSDQTSLRPMSARDIGVLEKRVDSLIELSRRMNVTAIELFQLIETRWKENS